MTTRDHAELKAAAEKRTYEVTIGVIVDAENADDALDIAEHSVGPEATVMTVQLADRLLLGPARARSLLNEGKSE